MTKPNGRYSRIIAISSLMRQLQSASLVPYLTEAEMDRIAANFNKALGAVLDEEYLQGYTDASLKRDIDNA